MAPNLIPCMLDEIARSDPNRVWAETPQSPIGYDSGKRVITYSALANAVNGVAWWLLENLGPAKDFETISYIGPNDSGHNIVLLGAVKAGYKLLLTSPRYGVVGQVRLMKETKCKNLLVSERIPQSQTDPLVIEHGDLSAWPLPSLSEFFDVKQRYFPYDKSYEQGKAEPLVVIHTSGTSGFPKPIVWTHEWATAFGRQRHLEPPKGYENLETPLHGSRNLSLMPPFHAGNLFYSLLFAFYCEAISIYPPSDMPPSAQTAVHVAEATSVQSITALPATIDELGANNDYVDALLQNGVHTIFWAGGPASPSSSEAVAKSFKLFTTCGSTETGMWPSIRVAGPWSPDTWRYMCFHPRAGIDYREQVDNVYSIVFVKGEGNSLPPALYLTSDDEFDTKDMFHHCSDLGEMRCWAYRGRSDDLQVLQSGFKWHPVATEHRIINENRDVIQEVLLVGTGLSEIIMLLEPTQKVQFQLDQAQPESSTKKHDEILDGIWPTVESVNRNTPVFINIDRQHVVFVESTRPMLRTAKGNVQRKKTVEAYENEIHAALGNTSVVQSVY